MGDAIGWAAKYNKIFVIASLLQDSRVDPSFDGLTLPVLMDIRKL
jgi:hypothetical protein